ncbi:MAG: hypothetical protein ACM34I_10545 [bacterium]
MNKYTIFINISFIFFLILILTACAIPGSYSISTINGVEKVYRYNENKQKVLIYEVDKSGKLTVYDETDPRAQQRRAQQRLEQKVEQANADRIEKIKQAPKRRPSDPIFVYLRPIELDEQLKKAEKPKGAVFDQIKKEIGNDSVIRLVGKDKVKTGEMAQAMNALRGDSLVKAPGADVEVAIRGYLKEVYGLTQQGKPGSMIAVVFEATVTSNFLPASPKVEESGNIFRNAEVTRQLGEKIKHIIKNEIGPTIPADRSL